MFETRYPIYKRPQWILAGAAATAVVAVALALVSQHVFGMHPCPWCTLQRFIYLVFALFAGLGAATSFARRPMAILAMLAAATGMAAAIWQHFKAANEASCDFTLAERILGGLKLWDIAPSVFEPTASCAEAAVNLFGIPYALWSLALFTALALAALSAWKLAGGFHRDPLDFRQR